MNSVVAILGAAVAYILSGYGEFPVRRNKSGFAKGSHGRPVPDPRGAAGHLMAAWAVGDGETHWPRLNLRSMPLPRHLAVVALHACRSAHYGAPVLREAVEGGQMGVLLSIIRPVRLHEEGDVEADAARLQGE
jgi:hypothetical protein